VVERHSLPAAGRPASAHGVPAVRAAAARAEDAAFEAVDHDPLPGCGSSVRVGPPLFASGTRLGSEFRPGQVVSGQLMLCPPSVIGPTAEQLLGVPSATMEFWSVNVPVLEIEPSLVELGLSDSVLLVTTSELAEARFAHQAYLAHHRYGSAPLLLFLTTTGRIKAHPEGVLGPIWRSAADPWAGEPARVCWLPHPRVSIRPDGTFALATGMSARAYCRSDRTWRNGEDRTALRAAATLFAL